MEVFACYIGGDDPAITVDSHELGLWLISYVKLGDEVHFIKWNLYPILSNLFSKLHFKLLAGFCCN